MHYGRISRLLCQDTDNNLSNRVIHISVQLLSNGNLANRLIDEHRLHRVILCSLNSILKACLIPSIFHSDEGNNEHFVVDNGHEIMRNNSYWALISDLHNLLAHRDITLKFLRDLPALELWANILMAIQGMNVNERELEQHVEFESRDYYAAFTAEIEISASTLWCMMISLKDQVLRKVLIMKTKNKFTVKLGIKKWRLCIIRSKYSYLAMLEKVKGGIYQSKIVYFFAEILRPKKNNSFMTATSDGNK